MFGKKKTTRVSALWSSLHREDAGQASRFRHILDIFPTSYNFSVGSNPHASAKNPWASGATTNHIRTVMRGAQLSGVDRDAHVECVVRVGHGVAVVRCAARESARCETKNFFGAHNECSTALNQMQSLPNPMIAACEKCVPYGVHSDFTLCRPHGCRRLLLTKLVEKYT